MKTHVDEVAVQEGVYKHDQDLTYTIPVPVDVHEAVLLLVSPGEVQREPVLTPCWVAA